MTEIKLGTFAFEAGKAEAGVLVGEDKVVKLAEGYAAYAAEKKPALMNLPSCMVEMMKLGKAGAEAARNLVEWIPSDSDLLYDLTEDMILNPINPTKSIWIGRTFATHVKVGKLPDPECPHIFLKPSTSFCKPGEDVVIPNIDGKPYDKVTYGCELTAVIGSTAKYCTEENIMDHVAGWTISNDVTCRGVLYPKNKMFDKFAPFGPYIIPADQIEDPNKVELKFKVDGEWKQEGNTGVNTYWTMQTILANLTHHMTLNPGDVIALGDIGAPETITAGQTMEAIIPQIGVLKNKIVNEKAETGICPGGAMGQ